MLDRFATVDSIVVSEILCTTGCLVLHQYSVSASRVPTGQGKLENVEEFLSSGNVRENIIFKKSGEKILDYADCR